MDIPTQPYSPPNRLAALRSLLIVAVLAGAARFAYVRWTTPQFVGAWGLVASAPTVHSAPRSIPRLPTAGPDAGIVFRADGTGARFGVSGTSRTRFTWRLRHRILYLWQAGESLEVRATWYLDEDGAVLQMNEGTGVRNTYRRMDAPPAGV